MGPEYGALAELLGRLRDEVKRTLRSQRARQQAWEAILDSDVLDLLRQGRLEEAEERARACICSRSG